MSKKTASGLVNYAKAQLGKPYWYGTFGQNSTKELYYSKKRQYPNYYTATNFLSQLDEKVHDCIGLIKGYIWCDDENDKTPKYQSNGCPDVNEEMMYNEAKTKGDIDSMPDVAGICVLMPGHIGVYVGEGKVVEARGHSFGVVQTQLNARNWTKWCECPYIEYDTKTKVRKKKKKEYVIVQTNKSVLNCREKSSILSKVVGTFSKGTKLEVKMKKKNWYKVEGKATSGKRITGFCSKKWLKPVE